LEPGYGIMIEVIDRNKKGVLMKKSYKNKTKKSNNKVDLLVLVSKWDNVDDYSEEEIEDLLEENHIPEVSYIEKIEKPENIIFD
jgi:signal recognition particle receptor subunit beta